MAKGIVRPSEPSDEEEEANRKAIAAVPGIYADTWFIGAWKGHTRITFGEVVTASGIEAWRTAVVMETPDAEKLCKQVLEMIERRKEKVKKVPSEEKDD